MSSYTSGDRLTYSEYLRLTELLDLQLGEKLKIIEREWVKNNFKISDQQVDNIVNN